MNQSIELIKGKLAIRAQDEFVTIFKKNALDETEQVTLTLEELQQIVSELVTL